MNEEYIGNPHYPVNVLNQLVLNAFESIIGDFSLQLKINKGLSSKIKYFLTDEKINVVAEIIKPSSYIPIDAYIKLYDNYCQFYWSLCYCVLVITDEQIQKESGIENEFIKKAYQLFSAAMKLFSEPDRAVFLQLPNSYNNKDKYTDKADTLYILGMSFILYHECAHFDLEHLETIGNMEDELVADSIAFWDIYSGIDIENIKSAQLGIVTALCSFMFLDNTMTGGTHPDPDDRIEKIIQQMENFDDHYWMVICICYKMWAFHYDYTNILDETTEFDTWEDYYNHIRSKLKQLKSENE